MTDIKPGDEVRVLKRRSRHDPFPADGYAATVTKVGRKYATATYEVTGTDSSGGERRYERSVEFDMETGIERGHSSMSGYYVRSPEQFERDKRRAAARDLLRDHGIEFSQRHPLPTLEQLEELAAVVKHWDMEG